MFATTDSVVRSVEATLVAFCNALLVTLAGSRIPALIISTKLFIVSIEALANRELFYFVNDHSALKACVGYDVE